MGVYEDIGLNKSPEDVLRDFGNADFIHAAPNVVAYVTAVARVKSASEAIRSQQACTSDIVTAVDGLTRSTNEAVRSQQASTTQLVTAVGELTKSISQASADSGKLGLKIAILTGALVGIGAGQIIATAWPYLAWWWHH